MRRSYSVHSTFVLETLLTCHDGINSCRKIFESTEHTLELYGALYGTLNESRQAKKPCSYANLVLKYDSMDTCC
jgi:hypothetical protein